MTSRSRQILISDIHFGVRKNSMFFLEEQLKFLHEVFFPFLDDHPDIKIIKNLGDVFDDRKNVSTLHADAARLYYYEQLKKRDIVEELIVGNHDIFWREFNRPNAPENILADFIADGVVKVFTEAYEHPDDDCLLVPWINDNNVESMQTAIANSKKKYCFGHFELNGYLVNRGHPLKRKGFDPKLLNRFLHVYSGHFHHRHTIGNVTYVGSPTQHTWADVGDPRGFHVFNFDTGEAQFIENPKQTFKIVDVDEIDKTFKMSDYRDCYVRVLHSYQGKQTAFDKFIKELSAVAINVDPIGKVAYTNIQEDLTHVDVEYEDTPILLREYVEDDDVYDCLISLLNKASALTDDGKV